MRLARAFVVPLCLAAIALAGCGLNPSGTGTGTTLRIANLIPGATSVSVTIGGNSLLSNAPFQTVTDNQNIEANTYTFNVNLEGDPTPAYTSPNVLATAFSYTFLTYGATSNVGGLLLADTLITNVPSGNFALRLANVSPTATSIDVYLTAPGTDLSKTTPIISGIAYQTNSAFINVPLGNYELRITRTQTTDLIYDGLMPSVAESSGQTIVAYSRGSSRLVNVMLMTTGGPSTTIDNRFAQIKAVNASSVASPLNVFLDGNIALANIPYTGVSNYLPVTAGTPTLTVEASATPGATLLTATPTFSPATDTSIALYGSAGSLGALVLPDLNVATLALKAQVRFVNVSPDLAAIDVYANGTLAAPGVAQNTASPYELLDAVATGTVYQFDVDTAGTTTPVLSVPGVTLIAGSIYTIYVMGPAGALQGIVVQDF